ncbi:MAG: lipocalin family protein [Tenacibaculum sp.]
MKKVLTLFVKVFSIFTFLLASTLTYSQEINELDFLTSGKWQLESVQIGDEVQDFSKDNSWMSFKADGQYQIVMSNNQKQGTWTFDENKKAIKIEGDKELVKGLKIELLNNKELLFSATEGDLVYTMKLRK